MSVYFKELKFNRKALIIWSVIIIAIVYMSYIKFVTMYKGNQEIMQVMTELPKAFAIIMGITSNMDFSTAKGFFGLLSNFNLYLLIFHAGLLGAHVISHEEEDKTSEFLYSKPLSRSSIISLKIYAGITNCIIFNLVMFLTTYLCLGLDPNEPLTGAIIMFSITSFIIQMIYFFAGSALSASNTPSKANAYNMAFLFVTLIISKALDLAGNASLLWILSPIKYFNIESYLYSGRYNLLPWILSIILISVFIYTIFKCYKRKDLR